MSITIQDVEQIAKLARLEFTREEKEKLTHQMNQILTYMEKLNEVDTTNVEPLSHVIELDNVFRDDVVQPSSPRQKMLQNAPDHTEEFFKVPKVIGPQ
jgi:aspartyl-tRNA(Asn)/glutamyl-tRNA(Gln) amidotransferase subunit C